MNLTVDVIEEEASTIVKLTGEIDVYTSDSLKEILLPLTKKSGEKIKIDMEGITYLDSTGLGVFISAYKSTEQNNSELELIHVKNRVLRLFKVTGLHEIMNVTPQG